MRERVNKPRVFLSYSSLDVAFIEKIENDLRNSQIDSWRDRHEIRAGRRWQQVIFEEGLPTCDVIVAYFTENSLTSDMFAKEVDAAQLRQLQDNGIAFLPYVSKSEIRDKLRLDIQSLHCNVWNNENYYEIFPSVVAEIWRSYMERIVATVILQERNQRLQAELDLERLQARLNASAFTAQEESEFQHIYSSLAEPVELYSAVNLEKEINEKLQTIEIGRGIFRVPFIELLLWNIKRGGKSFGWGFLANIRKEFDNDICLSSLPSSLPEGNKSTHGPYLESENELTTKLLILGLVKEHSEKSDLGRIRNYRSYSYRFTERMYRLVSWLDYYNKVEDKFSVEFIGFVDKDSYKEES